MKIVSWNCHYGLNKEKFEKLLNDSDFDDADIYAFQEVHENDFIKISDFENTDKYKYRHWYGDHQEFGNCHKARSQEGDLGIVLISKNYRMERFDEGLIRFRYVVPYFMLEDGKEKFILIHVWTKGNPDGYIKPIYDALEFYKEQFDDKLPIVMVGDFNFGINFENQQHKKELVKIEKKIKELSGGLVRSEKFENCVTFMHVNINYYFNDCFYTKGMNVEITIGDKSKWINSVSDHCPIMAELDFKK